MPETAQPSVIRTQTIAVALGVLALAGACGGGGRTTGQRTHAQASIVTVAIEGIGPALALSRPAHQPSACTVYERATALAVTFAAANAQRICEHWIRAESTHGGFSSRTTRNAKRKVICIFLVQPVGLVEVDDSPQASEGSRLCTRFGELPRWMRFTAAEEAKRHGQAIPLLLDVPSSSMEPTLHCARPRQSCEARASDLLVIDLVRPSTLKRGDIVAFKAPPRARECGSMGDRWVKRLIGLPGERWREKNGYVYVDGTKLDEPYVKPDRRDRDTSPERTIPSDGYLVLGDNRMRSCDSRLWGPVPVQNIIGRVSNVIRK